MADHHAGYYYPSTVLKELRLWFECGRCRKERIVTVDVSERTAVSLPDFHHKAWLRLFDAGWRLYRGVYVCPECSGSQVVRDDLRADGFDDFLRRKVEPEEYETQVLEDYVIPNPPKPNLLFYFLASVLLCVGIVAVYVQFLTIWLVLAYFCLGILILVCCYAREMSGFTL